MLNNPDIKNQLRVNNTIYYSLITGLLLFFIVVMVFIQDNDPTAGKELDNIFTFLVPIFGLMMMFISRMIYNQMILKFDSAANLLQKISHYRTAKIVSWAMIEGACFFALVAIMLTSNYLYVAVYIFLFGYFFLMRPSKESLVRDMRLNSEESDLILES
jgi:hypothetical protein